MFDTSNAGLKMVQSIIKTWKDDSEPSHARIFSKHDQLNVWGKSDDNKSTVELTALSQRENKSIFTHNVTKNG